MIEGMEDYDDFWEPAEPAMPSVLIGMPSNRDLPLPVVSSLLNTQLELTQRGIEHDIHMEGGCSIVEMARSRVAEHFLRTPYERLFWIDSDIVWNVSSFMRLLELSTRMECLSAAYVAKNDSKRFLLGVPRGSVEANADNCFTWTGVGLGFTIVHRTIIEQLAAKAPQVKTQNGIVRMMFHCGARDDQWKGEDMNFFADVRDLGFKTWIDPMTDLGHIGSKTYTGSLRNLLCPEEMMKIEPMEKSPCP